MRKELFLAKIRLRNNEKPYCNEEEKKDDRQSVHLAVSEKWLQLSKLHVCSRDCYINTYKKYKSIYKEYRQYST